MSFSTTPNYALKKPVPDADDDQWGTHLNQNADVLDSAIPFPSSTMPAMDGAAAVGTGTSFARADHAHPSDVSRYAASNPAGYVTAAGAASAAPVQSVAGHTGTVTLTHADITDWTAALAPYAPLVSPALTGSPTVPTVTPSTDSTTKIANTAFVQSAVAALPAYAPLASPVFTGDPQAPTAASGDNDTSIATTGFVTAAIAAAPPPNVLYGNVGRSLIHNGLMNVQQRGQGPWTASGYTVDRWLGLFFGGTSSWTVAALADADRAAGDATVTYALQNVFTGGAAAANYTYLLQRVEGVRRLAGETVIVSFYAKASSGTLQLGIGAQQSFGTGGSPSALIIINAVPVTLSTTGARYSVSLSMPSMAGKTLGTNRDDFTELSIYYSAGSNLAARAGIGVQSGTIEIWGPQLEVAQPGQTQPTPLDSGGSPQQQLAECQRFYQAGSLWIYTTAGAAGSYGNLQTLPTTMRAKPTVAANWQSQTNGTGNLQAQDASSMLVFASGAVAGLVNVFGTFTASADL